MIAKYNFTRLKPAAQNSLYIKFFAILAQIHFQSKNPERGKQVSGPLGTGKTMLMSQYDRDQPA
jgi:predicted ATPase